MKLNQKGITLIELLIVVIVLGVIAAISIPAVGRIIENTRIKADHENAMTLNHATRLYQLSNPRSTVFKDGNLSSEDLIEYLFQERFINEIIEPLVKDGFFTWNYDLGEWRYRDLYIISSQDIEFEFEGGQEGMIKGVYSGTSKRVSIPDMIDGVVVRQIDQDVFNYYGNTQNGKQSNTPLEQLFFSSESQITQIHARSFRGNELKTITFPESLKYIDGLAFSNNELEEIFLPESLLRIQWEAFRHNNLTKVTIPSGVELWQRAFLNNPITQITIGDNVNFLHDNDVFDHPFKASYEANGAGTYIWNGTTWVKQ